MSDRMRKQAGMVGEVLTDMMKYLGCVMYELDGI